jgi:hypothetical protein
MKAAFKLMLGLAIVFTAVMVAQAQDKAETKTLKGEMACPSCVFKLKGLKGCHNAIKVKEAGKEVFYILVDNKKGEPYHRDICRDTKKGSVKGTIVKTPDGMPAEYKYIKPEKGGVKFD